MWSCCIRLLTSWDYRLAATWSLMLTDLAIANIITLSPGKKKYQSNSFIKHPHSRSLKKITNILYARKVWVNTQTNEWTPSRGSLIAQWSQAHTWWVLVLSLTMATDSKPKHMPFVNSTTRRASIHPKSCRWFGVAFVHRPMWVTTDRMWLVNALTSGFSLGKFRYSVPHALGRYNLNSCI